MKNYYIDNFALRLLICVASLVILWNLGSFIGATFIRHEAWNIRPVWDIVLPAAVGVLEAFVWKNPADRQ